MNPIATIHPHDVDFYTMWKPSLNYEKDTIETDLQVYNQPCSKKICDFIGNMTKIESIDMKNPTFKENKPPPIMIQVFKITKLCNEKKNKEYILKRNVLDLEKILEFFDGNKIKSKRSKEDFVRTQFNEFVCIKILSLTPYGGKAIQFSIIEISNNNQTKKYIVTETLMEFVGDEYSKVHFDACQGDHIVEIFIKCLNALYFLQSYRVVQGDIKTDNIMIKIDKKNIIWPKIIDFDISKILSITFEEGEYFPYSLGLSPGYSSPEILKIDELITKFGPQGKKQIKFDPWPSQIYSFAIYMIKIIDKFSLFKFSGSDLDNLKMSEEKHQKILQNAMLLFQQEEKQQYRNIIFILIKCLQFSPEERPTIIELLALSVYLEYLKDNEIEDLWKKLIEYRKITNSNKIQNYSMLSNEFAKLKDENNNLKYKLHSINVVCEELEKKNLFYQEQISIKDQELIKLRETLKNYELEMNIIRRQNDSFPILLQNNVTPISNESKNESDFLTEVKRITNSFPNYIGTHFLDTTNFRKNIIQDIEKVLHDELEKMYQKQKLGNENENNPENMEEKKQIKDMDHCRDEEIKGNIHPLNFDKFSKNSVSKHTEKKKLLCASIDETKINLQNISEKGKELNSAQYLMQNVRQENDELKLQLTKTKEELFITKGEKNAFQSLVSGSIEKSMKMQSEIDNKAKEVVAQREEDIKNQCIIIVEKILGFQKIVPIDHFAFLNDKSNCEPIAIRILNSYIDFLKSSFSSQVILNSRQ